MPAVVASLEVTETVLQPSLAVGVPNVGVAGQLIILLLGAVIVGGVISCTVMVCDAVAVLLRASVAVHFLVTEKLLAQVPAVVLSLKVNVGAVEQLSLADGDEKVGVAGQLIVPFAPTPVIVGGTPSATVTE